MTREIIAQLGRELHEALVSRKTVKPLTERGLDLTIEDAYAIQECMLSHRLAAGQRVIGKKVGATSKAVQAILGGVPQPDFGLLLDGMLYNDGETVDTARLIQPKAEGEIAFFLRHDLMGPGITAADVLRATEGVMPCMEIVDSRITDWKIKIQDTVADNASCGVFVLGDRLVDPRRVDLGTCGLVVSRNGDIATTGSGAAVLGHPANSVAWLANTLGRLGIPLKAGEVILSGALAPLVPVAAGDNFRITIGGIGNCSIRFA
jgi:2-oxopent-4-enoate/cis-2-oxohex-4-enoate hydratase